METWYPSAIRVELPNSGVFLGGPYRTCVHTTEGSKYAGALAAYKANSVCPHFTASFEIGSFQVWQHVPLDRSASALEHHAGTVETNRQSAIQIEVVGFATQPNWPAGLVEGMGKLLAWLSTQTGVRAHAPEFLAYPASYGSTRVRMSSSQWLTFDGVCGHEHVPNNVHGDPGAIPINSLLSYMIPKDIKAMYSPNLILEPIAASLAYNGGVYLAADSGAFYAFNAPGIIGANGQPYFVGRHVARLYPGDSTDPEIPAYIARAAGGLIIRTTDNAWYGPYSPKP